MFTLVITEKGGQSARRKFDQPEVTIGRVQGNDVVLPKSNISKRHSRIIDNAGTSFVVVDSKSTNGTYINGKRIDAPYDIKEGDKIFIGDFVLEIEAEAIKAAPPPPPPEPEPEPKSDDSASKPASTRDLLGKEEWGADADLEDDWDDDWGSGDDQADEDAPEPTFGDEPNLDDLLKSADLPVPGAPPTPPDFADEVEPEPKPKTAPIAEQDNTPTPTPVPVPMPKLKAKSKAAKAKAESDPAATKAASVAKTRSKMAAKGASAPKAKKSKKSARGSAARAKARVLVHEQLLESLDLRRLGIENMEDEELRQRTEAAALDIVESMIKDGSLPEGIDAQELVTAVLDEALGLGPLEELLEDDSITEILVNSADSIYVERFGKLEATDASFSSDQAVLGVIERIVAPIGRRIDESSPMVDARLKDGSRVNAIIPPLSLKGPTLTIRKFTAEPLMVDDLVGYETLTPEMAEFLEMAVNARKNILISGGTGSGKTTTLNVLSGYIPETERIITIEDAAELKLAQDHVVSLETRPPNIEGRGAIGIRELVKNALRMRPDRIVVGECRGGEALDMLQAMNTGHEGSLTTVHANAPRDALARLETMVLMSGMELPVRAIRDQIASAIDIVVQQSRFPDGSRRITHISEITGMEGDVISMQDIFIFAQEGYSKDGKIKGQHQPTGFIPRFYEDLKAMGIKSNMKIFNP